MCAVAPGASLTSGTTVIRARPAGLPSCRPARLIMDTKGKPESEHVALLVLVKSSV